MSHDATNWAIRVVRGRQLKPAAKLVLWHLADRFHPDNGCFPAQDTLAADCEMSRSSLNNQLAILEREGLIRRERRQNTQTNRRMSTRYILGCEPDFAQEPCPKSGHGIVSEDTQSHVQNLDMEPCPKTGQSHVQNLDTNLVKEPVRIPPLPPEGGGSAPVRLEGFDLFLSIWPDDWPELKASPKVLRARWRAAVDRYDADAVLASARNYLEKAQAAGGTKASVGWFLARKSGLVAKFMPPPSVPVEDPVVLEDSETNREHRFLADCRTAGAPEAAIRRWARPGAFRIVTDGAVTAAVMADGFEDFKTAFGPVIKAHGLPVWPESFLVRRRERKRSAG